MALLFHFVGTYYVYDVSFKPKRKVFQDNPAMSDHFHLMYQTQNMSTYIMLYNKENFKRASNQTDPLECHVNESPAKMFFDLKPDTIEYVDENSMELSLNPGFFHRGQEIAYKSSRLYVNVDKKSVVNTQNEPLRNRAFINFYSDSQLANDFDFGHIKVKKP